MKQPLTLISSVRLVTLSNASALARCTISAVAAAVQLFIYFAWTSSDTPSNLPLWCWLAALDMGFVSGTDGLSAARSWRGRLFASGLLLVHLFSLMVLFVFALSQKFLMKGTFDIH